MSSALIRVGESQILQLYRKLIIGIRVNGTIVQLDLNKPQLIRPRPFLSYFAQTLSKLQCDVTLFIPATTLRETAKAWHLFAQRNLPYLTFQMVEDVLPEETSFTSIPFSYTNYKRYLHERAQREHTPTQRVLLIENEISHRYLQEQTLILHKYRYLTPRQIRKLAAYQSCQINTNSNHNNNYNNNNNSNRRRKRNMEEEEMYQERLTARELGLEPSSSRWEQYMYAQHVEQSLQAAQGTTNLLIKEQLLTDAASLENPCVHIHTAYQQKLKEFEKKTTRAKVTTTATTKSFTNPENECPASIHSNNMNNEFEETKSVTLQPTEQSSHEQPHELASLNMEDCTLVALSEMLTELAASECSVREYLQREVLIEELSVPSYGSAFYLPVENCDNILPLNWEEITVVQSECANENNNNDNNDNMNTECKESTLVKEPSPNFFR